MFFCQRLISSRRSSFNLKRESESEKEKPKKTNNFTFSRKTIEAELGFQPDSKKIPDNY